MGGSASRALVPGLAVLTLLGVVAVAASGSAERGSDETRAPADALLDTILTLGVVAWVAGAVLLVYGLTQRKAIANEIASGNYRRTGVLGYIAFALLFGILWHFFKPEYQGSRQSSEGEAESTTRFAERLPRPDRDGYEADLAWIPVLVLVVLIAIGIGAYFLATRRNATAHDLRRTTLAEEVADSLEDSLDDLRAEADARRAVIAAYARLEQALAASGISRSRHETAEEHVTRVLGRLEVDDGLVTRLAELFAEAKFSHHPVDETMKEEAIAALAQIRDELRAAARRRIEESARQLTELTATS